MGKDKEGKTGKLSDKVYEKELERLQGELVKLQLWVKEKGLKVIVVFEGRDAAGKGGMIKRMTERVSPRIFRVVALPAPTDREKSQMYSQRYINHFPGAGEVVIFDRSWYNRAGVERVMGFCTRKQYVKFIQFVPNFELTIVNSDIILIKYWLDTSIDVQEKRFRDRIEDPRKIWKLSPMDVASFNRWFDYSQARDDMLLASDTQHAPWYIVPADDKKRARLNCISHFLSQIPYEDLEMEEVELGERDMSKQYDDQLDLSQRRVVPQKF
ncbi:polyphosphate kinase 2 [Pseudomonadota bacterium]